MRAVLVASAAVLAIAGCSSSPTASDDSGAAVDAATVDAAAVDAAAVDAAATDGSADDTGPGDDASAPGDAGPPCEDCLTQGIEWGTDGGFRCTRDSSALESCRTYVHRRVAEGCSPPDLECTNELAACTTTGEVTVRDVLEHLADPDVVAALAAAPVLYGTDSRPTDGQVRWFSVGGASVAVGGCSDPGCTTIPAGVHRFVDLLDAIDAQQLAIGECATAFPP